MTGDDAVDVPAPKSVFVTKGLHDGDFGGALGAVLYVKKKQMPQVH